MMVTDWNNLIYLAKIKKHTSFRNEISFFWILFLMPIFNVSKLLEFHCVFSKISEPEDKNFKTWNTFVKIDNLIGNQDPYFVNPGYTRLVTKNVQIHFRYWIKSAVKELDKNHSLNCAFLYFLKPSQPNNLSFKLSFYMKMCSGPCH